jgi:CelD/BcsL family acetyltransferase involved in cellulose biosynthesis
LGAAHPSVSVDIPRWEPGLFVLTYRIGEIAVFRKQFRALTLRTHFFDLTDNPAEPAPPFDRFRTGTEAIVTRSHPVPAPLPVLTAEDDVLRYVVALYTRYHTDLAGDFEGYLAKFSAKSRGTLRRKVRRFVELGAGCEMRVYKRADEMEPFHRSAREVSALTYQERLLDAGIPTEREFLEELVRLAESDSVRAYVLFLHGTAIAYLCCLSSNGVLLYSYLGYDPKHADLSPGTVLQYLAFQSLFAEQRFRALDFTEGQGEHKKFFATHQTLCADICYFPDSIPVRFWIGLHRAFDRTSVAAAAMLDKVGLKARLKRLLRRL